MKKEFYKITLGGNSLLLTLSLVVALFAQGVETTEAMQVELLDKLKITLTSPSVSGAPRLDTDASKPCYYEVDGDEIKIHLSGLSKGVHYLYVTAVYGTNTRSLFEATIESTGEAGETTEIEYDLTVVQGIGDGSGTPFDPSAMQAEIDQLELDMAGKADGQVYRVGESGDPAVPDVAKVYAHSVELSNGAVATGLHAVAEGGGTYVNPITQQEDTATPTASGDMSHAEGGGTASGIGSHAEGLSVAEGFGSHAEIAGQALGLYSHAEGFGKTIGNASHAEGASLISDPFNGPQAIGDGSHAEGFVTRAIGEGSHAEGCFTIATAHFSHAGGRFNIEDTNGDYAFIIGNGETDAYRSNAFAIDWNGNLVLFDHGTPVVLTPAKLAQLIA